MRGVRRYPTAGLTTCIIVLALVAWRLSTTSETPPALPAEGIETVITRVVDGDTLIIESGERIRLLGVDTPETKHPDRPAEPWGHEASEFTRTHVEGHPVRLEFDRERQDRYGRWLAYVFRDDWFLNEELIRQGYSRAETRFPFRSDRQRQFRKAEQEARDEQRGIWSDAQPR
ncbi:MAG: thermonuclease family protein [Planctomycetaceae bacterium]|nr:thermonuclease family protein [Planctomycetaceae bacterium]